MMFKRIRKICLHKDCNKKATHFGVLGRKSNGLCDYHYKEFFELKDRLEKIHEELIKN